MTELEQYENATRSIFRLAVNAQSEIADGLDRWERLKAYRIALHLLRPDLEEERIRAEIERVAEVVLDNKLCAYRHIKRRRKSTAK